MDQCIIYTEALVKLLQAVKDNKRPSDDVLEEAYSCIGRDFYIDDSLPQTFKTPRSAVHVPKDQPIGWWDTHGNMFQPEGFLKELLLLLKDMEHDEKYKELTDKILEFIKSELQPETVDG